MPVDLRVIEGEYLHDLLDQPHALENTLKGLMRPKELLDLASRLQRRKFQRIVLTGMGSSFHALHPLNLQLIAHGYTAIMVETSELVHHEAGCLDAKTLVVAVSQSGQSVEMLRLIEVNRKHATVVAVTNTPESPLAKYATASVCTQAGREFSVSCKTYVAALMALKWLGDILCKRDARQTQRELRHAPGLAAAYLSSWKDHTQRLAERMTGIRDLFLVGRGSSLAAVGTGALIVKESDHFHSEGMSSAAFRHGPMEMLSEETCVIVLAGDEKTRKLNQRLVDDVRQAGARAELLGETATLDSLRLPQHNSSIRPILEILPIQMLTLALAARAGREPGKFERATKITTTE